MEPAKGDIWYYCSIGTDEKDYYLLTDVVKIKEVGKYYSHIVALLWIGCNYDDESDGSQEDYHWPRDGLCWTKVA